MQSLTRQFETWARSKPADEPYDIMAPCRCALFQFLDAAGYPVDHALILSWQDVDGVRHETSMPIGHALCDKPHTFGALADRLSRIGEQS